MKEIAGIAHMKIREGQLEEFKRLAAQCMDVVRTKDTGTLVYEQFLSADGTECLVYERYRDSEASIEHSKNIGEELMKAIFDTCSSVTGEVYGVPSPELRANLEKYGVQIFDTLLQVKS